MLPETRWYQHYFNRTNIKAIGQESVKKEKKLSETKLCYVVYGVFYTNHEIAVLFAILTIITK